MLDDWCLIWCLEIAITTVIQGGEKVVGMTGLILQETQDQGTFERVGRFETSLSIWLGLFESIKPRTTNII
jgi:hypothetical protein